jgi:tetratricopeptide (TPR) repeat protein
MRRLLCWQFSVLLLLAGMTAAAQVPNSSQNVQPSNSAPNASTESIAASEAKNAPLTLKPGVTVTAKRLHPEPPLPKLPPDEFMNCERMLGVGTAKPAPWQVEQCESKMDREKNIVLGACYDLNGETAPRRVIQACTEALDRNVLEVPQRSFLLVGRADAYFALGDKQRALDDYSAAVKMAHLLPANERFLLFTPRADEYFALGDKQHALDDYDAAIKSAPHNAALYYNRGVVFIAQANYDAALQDFDTALKLDSRFVPALRQRAKIYTTRGNLAGALADYSQAIRLQPETAALWSDRGQVDLGRHEYGNAIEDEARAIQLDPKLASAYYLRSVAFANSGDRAKAVTDLHTAVGLDPSLATYVTIKGKTVVLELPPPL